MSTERALRLVRKHTWLAVSLSMLLSTVVSAQDLDPVGDDTLTRPTVGPTRGADVGGTTLPACEMDADCDDDNACTVDLCSVGECSNTQIPGCVPCQPNYACPRVEIVFLMDTSGSMGDEAAVLCSAIGQIVVELEGLNVEVSPTVLGITETPGGSFSCLTDDVVSLMGGDMPNNPGTCVFPGGTSAFESWGPATAIVADRFPWSDGATHIIVPIGDEGPCNGNRPDGCNDPGDDRDSVDNAIAVAVSNSVIVSPITGTGSNDCVLGLCQALAAGTGGTAFHTEQAGADLPDAIVGIILESCELDLSCDDENFCTRDDVCVEGVCSGVAIPGCVACTPSGFCSDGNACTDDECNAGFECISSPNFDDAVHCCDPSTGELTPLDDGNVCTVPFCDIQTGQVAQTPVDDNTPCDDGLFCTTDEACTAGECAGAVPLDCSDFDDACARGVCNEDVNACEAEPLLEGEPCDDGLYCTTGETCVQGVCSGGSPLDCSVLDDQCNVGVCSEQAGFCERQPAFEGESCDDGLFCTIGETCSGGLCGRGWPRDCTHLDETCINGVCDEGLDTCLAEPITGGETCDDGNTCTIWDLCDGDGGCSGIAVDTITCHDDDECFGSICNNLTGFCVCTIPPELCLEAEPTDGCYTPEEEFAVRIRLGETNRLITGGQFFVRYDPSLLEFVRARPGHATDPESPFVSMLFGENDPVDGTIFFAVTTGFGQPGAEGPATMATMHFKPLVPCSHVPPLCLTNEHPRHSVLTDSEGRPIAFAPGCCTEELVIGGEDAVVTCPESVAVNADAGGVTSIVTWDPVQIVGQTCGNPNIACSGTNSFGADVDELIALGGQLPAGLSQFECTATSDCGIVGTCSWSINVSPVNLVEMDFQLSPTVVPDVLNRCVHLEFFSSCVEPPHVVEAPLEFGGAFNLPGYATQIEMKIPAGRYMCATAQDLLHTLRSVAPMETVGTRFIASFDGDPAFGGNWLISGNLNGDQVIDGLDQGILLDELSMSYDSDSDGTPDGDTPCGTSSPHADINGDGVVDAIDQAFIDANWFVASEEGCCSELKDSERSDPVGVIRTRDLDRAGLKRAKAADFNADGVIDVDEITAYLQGQRAPAKAPQSRTLPKR